MIDAAICLKQMRLPLAKRIALDAIRHASSAPRSVRAAADFAASIVAEIAHEDGRMEDAKSQLIERLPTIRAGRFIESAIGAIDILGRVAAYRGRALLRRRFIVGSRFSPRLFG